MASRDWIKNNYIVKEVPGPLIHDTANIVYPYESTDVLRDESLHMVLIQRQASIHNQYQHFCRSSCLPISFATALWSHR